MSIFLLVILCLVLVLLLVLFLGFVSLVVVLQQVHHIYRSKFPVETLSNMGYASSYAELLWFEKNAASCVTPDLLLEETSIFDISLLFASDNVDHNIITIDGKGTFHGMGMIAAVPPSRKNKSSCDEAKYFRTEHCTDVKN